MITYIKDNLLKIALHKTTKDLHKILQKRKDNRILSRANQVKKHIFVFDDNWDMEPCSTPYTLEIIDWNELHHDDEEWVFMLNRMDYLRYLVLAYQYSLDTSYVEAWKELVLHWINTHPTIEYSRSTRTLDSAIRCRNIIETMARLYADGVLDEDIVQTICTSIMKQLHYLKDQYITKYTLSNWGFIQICTLLQCTFILDENYEQSDLYIWARKEFDTQMQLQILDDGLHWEQSTMYHVQVLHCLLQVLVKNEIYPFNLTFHHSDIIHHMCTSLAYLTMPQHTIEAYGDSDRSDTREMLSLASLLFQDSHLKSMATFEPSWFLLYEVGSQDIESYNKIHSETYKNTLFFGQDSGIITQRSSWQENASFTQFQNTSLGSAHGHCDHLHISLCYKGQCFLSDSGRFSYREDHPLRVYLKSMYAHNTTILDNEPCSKPISSWEYASYATPLKNYVNTKENITYLEGCYINNGCPMLRKIIIIHPYIWMICDEIHTQEHHQATTLYHYDPLVSIHNQNQFEYDVHHDDAYLHVIHEGVDTMHIKEEPCSQIYNQVKNHNTVHLEHNLKHHNARLDHLFDTSIHMEYEIVYQGFEERCLDSCVSARTYHVSPQESYTIILFHNETFIGKKIFYCKGIPLYAKCCVLHTNKETTQLYRLKT